MSFEFSFMLLFLILTSLNSFESQENCVSQTHQPGTPSPKCSLCEYSILNKITQQCENVDHAKVKDCRFYSQQNKRLFCVECDLGFSLDINANKCNACEIKNCLVCRNPNKCFSCLPDFWLNQDSTLCTNDRKCPVPNCDVCYSDLFETSCKICKDGFSLKSLVDRKCVKSTAHCFLLNWQKSGECAECLSGFSITLNGQCVIFDSSVFWYYFWFIVPFTVLLLAVLAAKQIKKNDEFESKYRMLTVV